MGECDSKKIEFYKQIYHAFRENANISWDMTKFYILLCSSLISINIGTLSILQTSEHFLNQNIILKMLILGSLLIFPLMIIYITNIGKSNFLRECKRMYEYLAIKIILEETYDLRGERVKTEDAVFPCEKYFVPERFKIKFKTIKEYVDKYTGESEDSYYSKTVRIYNVFNNVSYVLIGLILLVIIIQWLPFLIDP